MKRWMKWIVIGLVLAVLAAVALRILSDRKAQKAALEAQQATQKTQTAIELAPTDLVVVKTVQLSQGLAISGPLKAVNSAFVKARVAGELQGLTVREGDFVKAGQVVARVDATESQARVRQAQQQAESAKAQVDIAKRAFDNNRSLVEQGFISKTALDSSIATLSSAEANYRAAQAGADVASKSLDDTVLRAPIAGQIAQRLAQPGERVAVDARIVEIVDLSRLELEASLSAADSLSVKVGQAAQLTVEGAAKPLNARVVRVNPSAVAGSRAVLAYLAIDTEAGLRQGLFAEGLLATGAVNALAVPLTAVRTDKPQPYVQVLVDGKVVHRTVNVGTRGDVAGQTMVGIEGVGDGASVLVGSVGTVREGTLVKTKAVAP
ncbi:efflux RND transporter periplasmic adaptor subunit [Rhodoferax saidenbachensis]|uniref:Efflux transporter periplasmic adaptor subunit n=1 Tax=Rhodoferax saidenbachensis TaxID=1484693 RepID=A0A1P8K7V6_9BURK|nr:efflux RND transporter periplasmic adaptor subunit [Rhodoferax saidenbachensis]APW42046.1 efflux transporter periplasmic adaptor subunit [Rhodoferax saidenbachensis]